MVTGFGKEIAQLAAAIEYTDCNPSSECPGYDTKQSDGEVPVMLGLWGIRSTPSLQNLNCLTKLNSLK